MPRLLRAGLVLGAAAVALAAALTSGGQDAGLLDSAFVGRPSCEGRPNLVARHGNRVRVRKASDRHGYRRTTIPLHKRKKPNRGPPPPLTSEQRDQLAYEKALDETILTKNYKRALSLLDLMAFRGLERRRPAFTSAVKACGKAGRPAEARKVLDTMRGAGFKPDHTAYHCTVEACKNKDPQQAMELLREMRDQGFPPNGPTYTQVITTLVKHGYREEAAELYDEAQLQGMYHVWGKDARFLDLQDLNIPLAKVAVRAAVEERAAPKSKAGRTGFYVLTGPANKRTAFKQQAILSVLRSEYGLKVRVDPAKFGRVLVKGEQLKRLGMERELSDAY